MFCWLLKCLSGPILMLASNLSYSINSGQGKAKCLTKIKGSSKKGQLIKMAKERRKKIFNAICPSDFLTRMFQRNGIPKRRGESITLVARMVPPTHISYLWFWYGFIVVSNIQFQRPNSPKSTNLKAQ